MIKISEDIDIKKALEEIIQTLPKLKKYDEIEVSGEIYRFNQDKVIIQKLNLIIKVLYHFHKVFFKSFPEIKIPEIEEEPKDIELNYII